MCLFWVGPPSSGKTKLLKEVRERRNLAQATEGDGPPPILYLDCRGKDISSPQQFARVMRELAMNDAPLKAWVKNVMQTFSTAGTAEMGGLKVTLDLGEIFMRVPQNEIAPMASIIDSLTTFLEAVRLLPEKPVIVIDEANKLMRWHDDPGHVQLKDLLDFFVRVTKQEGVGHIVLASSEYFLINWLENEGLKDDNYTVEVIGDLSNSDEAKGFVESRIRCGAAPPSFFDETEAGELIDMWPQVYEICGGSIGLLKQCASYAKGLGSWERGLKRVTKVPKGWVQKGLWPKGFRTSGSRLPAAWTKEDYKTVLREIALAKEHRHAVSFKKLQVEVGERAVLSLVEWNFVALRVESEWAKDLPEMVFNDIKDTQLVTMPSPVDLYCILKMHEDGELD